MVGLFNDGSAADVAYDGITLQIGPAVDPATGPPLIFHLIFIAVLAMEHLTNPFHHGVDGAYGFPLGGTLCDIPDQLGKPFG